MSKRHEIVRTETSVRASWLWLLR